jgi:hypothetical protein
MTDDRIQIVTVINGEIKSFIIKNLDGSRMFYERNKDCDYILTQIQGPAGASLTLKR